MNALDGRTCAPLVTVALLSAVALAGASRPAAAQIAISPSFDCNLVTNAVEELICNDPELARLDRAAADVFQATLRRIQPEEVPSHEALLGEWLIERNACRQEDDVRSCVRESYVRRIVAIRAQTGPLTAPAAFLWSCNDDRRQPFYTTFYDDTDPPSVMLTFGDDVAVATIEPSGSGARYAGPGIEFWQHGGEARVRWRGRPLVCTR